jgi:hypothetical protein
VIYPLGLSKLSASREDIKTSEIYPRSKESMFVSDRLIYLQLLKTGCTHITKLLTELVPGEDIQKHGRIPKGFEIRDRQVVGSIRNPWDWYVSLWGFGCDRKGVLYKRLSSRRLKGHGLVGAVPKVGMNDWLNILYSQITKPVGAWQEVYADSHNPELFRRWLKMVLDRNKKYSLGDGYGLSSISNYVGLLTYYYIHLFSSNVDYLYTGELNSIESLQSFDQTNHLLVDIIRVETLEDDFIRMIRHVGYHLSEAQEYEIKWAGKTNASSRKRSFEDYYDQETIDLVAEKEKLIIQKYNYSAPNLIQGSNLLTLDRIG